MIHQRNGQLSRFEHSGRSAVDRIRLTKNGDDELKANVHEQPRTVCENGPGIGSRMKWRLFRRA